MLLEVLDIRTDRERALATASDDECAHVAGRALLELRQCRIELGNELACDDVERRVVESKRRDRVEPQLDQAHFWKSAARPIGPSAYTRKSVVWQSSAMIGLKPICASTSRSMSMPGASSISVTPSGRSNTALSVM